jgi:high-affinity iron transporter
VIPGNGQAAFSVAGVIQPSTWYGTVLGGLFNFTPEPTWAQFVSWLAYLAVVTPLFLRVALSKPRSTSLQPTQTIPSHSTRPGDLHA